MEKIILGSEVKDVSEAGGKNSFCAYFCIVKKGHEECGDSAFVYSDENKAIFAVFDGVSGESGASSASSAAAKAIISTLKKYDSANEKIMKEALNNAHASIKAGLTTAVIAFIDKKGSFTVAGVGDSPIYSIDVKGQINLELPLARTVGNDASILKFFYYRNIVTSVLGGVSPEIHVHMRHGKIEEGEILILATDGLSDNLYVKTKEGYVTESEGVDDLNELIGKNRVPETIVRLLFSETLKRLNIGRIELKDKMLVPKEDDIAIIAVRCSPSQTT